MNLKLFHNQFFISYRLKKPVSTKSFPTTSFSSQLLSKFKDLQHFLILKNKNGKNFYAFLGFKKKFKVKKSKEVFKIDSFKYISSQAPTQDMHAFVLDFLAHKDFTIVLINSKLSQELDGLGFPLTSINFAKFMDFEKMILDSTEDVLFK